jgi:collagenase-like PrtC family protease
MISYTLPDFVNGLRRNVFFIGLINSHPEYFKDGVRINSVYGCFPGCIMNGGRTFIKERYTAAQMEAVFSLLEKHGVKARLTLTNMLIEEKHLQDEYFRLMMDCASNHDTEVVIYSDLLSRHIAQHYGFRQVLSTTRRLDGIGELNQATKHYDYVVLDYNRNKDRTFIGRIEDRDRIEVMVNEFCRPGCPYRAAHYRHNSKDQLDGIIRPFRDCDAGDAEFFDHSPDHPTILTNDQVFALHHECGINNFKIVGRGVPSETVLESYAYYLLKPEYQRSIKDLARHSIKRSNPHHLNLLNSLRS